MNQCVRHVGCIPRKVNRKYPAKIPFAFKLVVFLKKEITVRQLLGKSSKDIGIARGKRNKEIIKSDSRKDHMKLSNKKPRLIHIT